jgi:hypothetical protein
MKPNLELFGLIGDAEARLSKPLQSNPTNLVSIRIYLPNDNPREAIVLGYIKEGLAIHKPYKRDGIQETGIKCWAITHVGTGTRIGTVWAFKKRAEEIRDFLLKGIDWTSWGIFGDNRRENIPQECVTRYLEVRKTFEGEFVG